MIILILIRAVSIKPNVQTLNNLAYFYQIEYDDHQRAVELLEKAVKMEPNSGLPYGLLGEAYFELELYQKAEEAFTKALGFEENPSLLNNLGVALYKQGKIREAAGYFQKSWESEDRIKDNFLDLILNYGAWDEYLNPVLSYGVSMAQLGKTKYGTLKMFFSPNPVNYHRTQSITRYIAYGLIGGFGGVMIGSLQ
jgi:tetratricopeptide (TPR) repeat protein